MEEIFVDIKSATPIYKQIYDSVKNQILQGKMLEDEPLPSIRALAKKLKISMVTTKKGFDMLEKEGWIYTVPTKGSFVSLRQNMIEEQNSKKLEEMIEQVKIKAKNLGISDDELIEMIKYIDD